MATIRWRRFLQQSTGRYTDRIDGTNRLDALGRPMFGSDTAHACEEVAEALGTDHTDILAEIVDTRPVLTGDEIALPAPDPPPDRFAAVRAMPTDTPEDVRAKLDALLEAL